MDMDTDALGDLAVGDAMRMRFPGHGVFTGKVVGFEGNKVDVHWNEDSSSTLLTPAQALKARVAHAQAEPKRSPKALLSARDAHGRDLNVVACPSNKLIATDDEAAGQAHL